MSPQELDLVSDGVAVIQIASDDSPYLGTTTVAILAATVEELTADETVRVVVLEGGGRYFSGGASREALLEPEGRIGIVQSAMEAARRVLEFPVPTVAAMAGHAVGGGLVLGLWCDVAVLAEESMYGANFMALGFTPGMGSTWLLDETLGAPLARELLLTGRLVKGRELRSMSRLLTHAVVPRREVRSRALEIAREIAEVPREALLLLKGTLAARRRRALEAALEEEMAMQRVLIDREETRAAIAERYVVRMSNDAGHTGEGEAG